MIKKLITTILFVTCSVSLHATDRGNYVHVSTEIPVVSIIIDDLGTSLIAAKKAIQLPGEITYSVLPQTPYSRITAIEVNDSGREVMMHQPMESTLGHRLGKGGITAEMDKEQIYKTINHNFTTVPYSSGINNHMGSLVTADAKVMLKLMDVIRKRGDYYFVDSITTKKSVAQEAAYHYEIPTTRRNVFLDHSRDSKEISRQFMRMVEQAKTVGSSVAIGHPYPETLAVLSKLLPTLKEHGVVLIPVSEMIYQRKLRVRSPIWQASLSQSQKAQKSSKQ